MWRGGGAAIDGNDDDDVLFNDESFLAAVAKVESQHLGRMTNVLPYNGPKICGQNMFGGTDSNIAGKRSAHWEEQNSIRLDSGQLQRGGSLGSFAEDEYRKRIRTEEDTASRRPINWNGQANEPQLAPVRPSEGQKAEGEYMAALRGSNSEAWQSSGAGRGIITTAAGFPNGAGTLGSNFKGDRSGNCFNCGRDGHWSRDCTAERKVLGDPTNRAGQEAQGAPNSDGRFCPCGAGTCVVYTANTEKNPGRNFYKCPLGKDAGQCTFFEWCDAGGQNMPIAGSNSGQQPQLQCKCGGGLCIVRTAKTEKNFGREFYKCPQNCPFFQWCDESGRDVGGNSSTTPTRATDRNRSGTMSGYTTDWTCHKCHKPGHFAYNCPN